MHQLAEADCHRVSFLGRRISAVHSAKVPRQGVQKFKDGFHGGAGRWGAKCEPRQAGLRGVVWTGGSRALEALKQFCLYDHPLVQMLGCRDGRQGQARPQAWPLWVWQRAWVPAELLVAAGSWKTTLQLLPGPR